VPCLAVDDFRNRCSRHPKHLCELILRIPTPDAMTPTITIDREQASNVYGLCRGEFGVGMMRTRGVAIFHHAIAMIVTWRSEKQMRGLDAPRLIAVM
jgi:hypothetical protein